MAKAATSGILSAVVVMAWTGVYLSRHPRSSTNDTTYNSTTTVATPYAELDAIQASNSTTVSTPYIEVNNVKSYGVSENDIALRRDKVKEVN